MFSLKRNSQRPPSRRKQSYRPCLESLESRLAPSITVTNLNDAGTGSLRAAITTANASPGSTIVFNAGLTGSIDLLSALPALSANMTIQGPGANVLAVVRSSSATTDFGIFTVNSGATATISGLTAAHGTAAGIDNLGNLTLQQVVVTNNNSTGTVNLPPFGSPGGILNTGTLSISQSTIANNSDANASVAAGIDSESGSVTIVNSTITGNVANHTNSTGGIGIYSGTLNISSSTVSGNVTMDTNTSGGGIDSGGMNVTIYNTIVAGNTGASGNPSDVSGTFTSQGNNLIGIANSHSSGFVSSDKVGSAAAPINAKLGSLGSYGGPTPTLPLLAGSPAIDGGNNLSAPTVDQRGVTRPQGTTVDIGAYELSNPAVLEITTTPPASISAGSPFGLTVTAEDTNGNVATGFNGSVSITAALPALFVSAGTTSVTKVAPDGTTSTYATGFQSAQGLAFDSSGNLYVGDSTAGTVDKVTPAGSVTTFATGLQNSAGLVFDSAGNLYVAHFQSSAGGQVLSKVTPTGTVTTFATGLGSGASSLDGVVMDSSGNFYVANEVANAVYKVDPLGSVTTFISSVAAPAGLALDSAGNLYVALDQTSGTDVDEYSPTGSLIGTFASGFQSTQGLTFDSSGNLYVGDVTSIHKVTPSGTVSPFASIAANFLTFGPAGGSSSNLSGTTTVSAVNGVATFSGLSLSPFGTYTLTASSSGLTSATAAINVTPTPTKLIVTAPPPTSVAVGTGFGLTVTVEDNGGNIATGYTGQVTVAIASSTAGGTLSGPTTVSAVNGVATFNRLSLSTAGFYTLSISATGLAGTTATISATGGTLTVPPGATANLATPNNQPVTVQADTVNFQASSTLQVLLAPSASSQLVVTNDVNIDPTSNLVLNGVGAIPIGQSIKIIKAGGAVNGEFAKYPEGSIIIASNGEPFRIHYVHDPVLDGAVILTALTLDTTTALTVSPSPAEAGQPVTFTATVNTAIAVSSQALQITGAVSYSIDGGPPQPGTVKAQGGSLVNTLNTTTLSPGTHQVVATYTPDANAFFNASTSSPMSVTVQSGGGGVWTPLPPHVFVTAADAGGQPKVKVFDATSGAAIDDFFAYPAGFSAGVRVAAADLQGDGTPDLIVVPGPGGGSIIQVFDGRSGQMRLQFAAFANGDNLFTGGSYVAAADILGQGYDDIIVSADSGGGPAVAVFDGKTGQQVMFFFAFPNAPDGAVFTGGVRVAAGPYVPGGPAVIFTAAGPGGGPAVSVWSAADIAANRPEKTFYVLPPDANGNLFTGGVYLGAVAAGDGRDYLVTGAAPGGGPAVTLIDPLNTPSTSAFGVLVSQPFYALDPNFAGGVRVAGGAGVILTAAGPGGGPVAQSFSLSGTPLTTLDASDPDNPDFFGGLYVAAT